MIAKGRGKVGAWYNLSPIQLVEGVQWQESGDTSKTKDRRFEESRKDMIRISQKNKDFQMVGLIARYFYFENRVCR